MGIITVPDSILGEKTDSSSSSKPRLSFVGDRFSAALGVNFKVWSIPAADLDALMKRNREAYNPESHPRRIPYDRICCGVNPHKSVLYDKICCEVNPHKSVVLSRSHCNIGNTKKVSVGRLMRSGFKVSYLRRRQQRLAAYKRRRLAPANLCPLMKKDHRSKGIAYEKTCTEAKQKSNGLDDEQKKMLFHAIVV